MEVVNADDEKCDIRFVAVTVCAHTSWLMKGRLRQSSKAYAAAALATDRRVEANHDEEEDEEEEEEVKEDESDKAEAEAEELPEDEDADDNDMIDEDKYDGIGACSVSF